MFGVISTRVADSTSSFMQKAAENKAQLCSLKGKPRESIPVALYFIGFELKLDYRRPKPPAAKNTSLKNVFIAKVMLTFYLFSAV